MSRYHDSVKRLKEKEFRQYAEKYGSLPDADLQAKFDGIIDKVTEKRHGTYLEEIQRRYKKEWIEKVMDYARKLSPLELSKLTTFEELAIEFIRNNQNSVTTEEISSFFDSKGKGKPFLPDPTDKEIGEVDFDENGDVIERHAAPQVKKQSEITYEQAKHMTSDELAKILPHSD
jgi:hypothetical protein